jgi:hypothetical protein
VWPFLCLSDPHVDFEETLVRAREACAGVAPFPFRISAIGSFPNGNVHLTFDRSTELGMLAVHTALLAAFPECAARQPVHGDKNPTGHPRGKNTSAGKSKGGRNKNASNTFSRAPVVPDASAARPPPPRFHLTLGKVERGAVDKLREAVSVALGMQYGGDLDLGIVDTVAALSRDDPLDETRFVEIAAINLGGSGGGGFY